MAQAGTVKAINGYVTATTPGEEPRQLFVGDIINLDDLVVTSPGSNIIITLTNGKDIQLDGGQELVFDESLIAQFDAEDAAAQAKAIQDALARGEGLDELDEETATGEEEGRFNSFGDFLPGDSVSGNVGAYLLDSDNDTGFPERDNDPAGAQGNNNNPTAQAAPAAAPESNEPQPTYTFADPEDVPDAITLNPDGTYTFDPTTGEYDYIPEGETEIIVIDVIKTNPDGTEVLEPISIPITGTNDAPVITTENENFDAVEDGSLVTGQLTAEDLDDDAELTFTLSEGEDTPAGFILNPDGSFSFDPANGAYDYLAEGETTTIELDYTVTDDKGATDTSTLVITVTGTNDAPVAELERVFAIEGMRVVEGALDASDVDGEVVSYELIGDTPAGFTLDLLRENTVLILPLVHMIHSVQVKARRYGLNIR